MIDLADLISAKCKCCASRWLCWSVWWADFAEAMQTGDSISSIRKERDDEHHDS